MIRVLWEPGSGAGPSASGAVYLQLGAGTGLARVDAWMLPRDGCRPSSQGQRGNKSL